DESGSVRATWFNQPWVAERLAPGAEVRLIGSMRRGSFAVRSHEHAAPAELVPVYGGTEDLNPRRLRELVLAALPRAVWDPLPAPLCASERLPTRADALWALHRPRSREEAETGRRRLAFDELLLLQVGIARRARERERALAASLGEPGELIERYRSALPFTLTPYQESAIRELDTDLARTVPMQRLLQGDVGSGKTVVALYALLRAVENGRQGALMAPTETLAEQHYLTIADLCTSLGVTCALLTSSSSKAERQRAPTADVVVGTHALIQEGVEVRDLAVTVVDEQHRFGVEQRRALSSAVACDADQRSSRLGRDDRLQRRAPHVLHMTATPIP